MSTQNSQSVRNYFREKPFQKKNLRTAPGRALIELVAHRRQNFSDEYWSRFGYEYAGPCCYAFMKWLSDTLDEQYPNVTDIAFVGRDGYLLRQIYELLPHRTERFTHYIYAPRIIRENCSKSGDYSEYTAYLNSQQFNGDSLAIVDTVTLMFSSQNLIESALNRNVYGFYWVVLDGAAQESRPQTYCTFQKKGYHTIRCWNLMEFFMTSPEPPIKDIRAGEVIYYEANSFEAERVKIFNEMSAGALAFVQDLLSQHNTLPTLSDKFITKWINGFLSNPSAEDRKSFEPIEFSILSDHSDSIPLAPFETSAAFPVTSLIDRMWLFSKRHPKLYAVLHWGKKKLKRLLGK